MGDTTVQIGTLAFFRGHDLWATPAVVAAAFAAEGIEKQVPDLAVVPVSRARRAAQTYRTAGIRSEVIRFAGEAEIEIGILRFEKVANDEVRWVQFDSVEYAAGSWSTPSTPEGAAFMEWAEQWSANLDYGWVRSAVMTELDRMDAFVVGGGGIFYVSPEHDDRFAALQRVCVAIRGARLSAIRIDGSDPATRSAVADAAQDSVGDQVEDVVTRLTEWREKARGRTSTLDVLLTELVSIRNKALGLSTVLGFSMETLGQTIAGAEAEVQAALATAAPSAPPRAPREPGAPRIRNAMRFSDAAVVVLAEAGVPMHYRAITDAVLSRGLVKSTGATPWASLNAELSVDFAAHPTTCSVIRTSPGTWALRPGAAIPSIPVAESSDAPLATPAPAADPSPAPETCTLCAVHYGDSAPCDEGKPVASPHRKPVESVVVADEELGEVAIPDLEWLENCGSRDLAKLCRQLGIPKYARMTDIQRLAEVLRVREQRASA